MPPPSAFRSPRATPTHPRIMVWARRGRRVLAALCGVILGVGLGDAALEVSDALLARVEQKYGTEARGRVETWRTLLQTAQTLPEMEKLRAVNNFFNRYIEFVDDIFHWHQEDYWATPIESLGTGGGDCEDFAIAKYFTLLALGVAEDKLRMTYVKALQLNQAHMVLTYFATPRAVPLVLDNLIPDIKPASQRNDLLPVYSFNGTGLWIAKARGEGKRVGGAERLSLWQALQARMQAPL